jgi:hypothetical protein
MWYEFVVILGKMQYKNEIPRVIVRCIKKELFYENTLIILCFRPHDEVQTNIHNTETLYL